MQRVVRSTFLGVFTLAALAACGGDKVVGTTTQVTAVTVTPANIQLAVGGSATVTATVTATAGVTDRTVTWKSADASVATVDASGKVTGVAGGTTSIIATSNADVNVSGAAGVTVAASVPPTVTISSIMQGGVSANLASVMGQLDVTLNVDPGTQKLSGVDLVVSAAGKDTVVASLNLSAAQIAEIEANAATAPVTLSFNTAAFNATTGVVAFFNGPVSLKAVARVQGGTQSASSTQTLTLANTDFIIATTTTVPSATQVAQATDVNGFSWRAGAINVATVPVIYTPGRTIASTSVSLVNKGSDAAIGQAATLPAPVTIVAGGVVASQTFTSGSSATFANSTTAAGGVGGATVDTLGVGVTTVDNSGNPGPSLTASAANFIRLDNRAPDTTGVVSSFATQGATNDWIGANFSFSLTNATPTPGNFWALPTLTPSGSPLDLTGCALTTVANFPLCDWLGVDKVTTVTSYAVGSSSTYTPFASVSEIQESSAANAYKLRVAMCDALGNCTNRSSGTFGVDVTSPKINADLSIGPAPMEIVGIGQALSTPTYNMVISDSSGVGSSATGSGFGANPLKITQTRLLGSGSTGQTLACAIGTPTSPAGNGCSAPDSSGAAPTFDGITTTSGLYTTNVQAIDQAGNLSTVFTGQYYIDQVPPAVSGGSSVPNPITVGSIFTSSATDNMDLASANAYLDYGGIGIPHILLGAGGVGGVALSSRGVAFDNVLNRAASITATTVQFYRTLAYFDHPALLGIFGTGKPSKLNIRAVDAAGNLSMPNPVDLPAGNISGTGAVAFTVGKHITNSLNGMTVAVTAPDVRNPDASTTNLPTTTTITASVVAPTASSTTPFTSVCFYYRNETGTEGGAANKVNGGATGELVLIGCTTTPPAETTANTVKTFTYSMAFNPDDKFGSAGAIPIFALGVNANSDALLAIWPALLNLHP
jgi:Bacterial Ig-like domain (group 2)